jgi:hypothetical protein
MNEHTKPPNGYNPMRWDCESQGCFNRKLRPKIEMFADCFPGRISLGDIDGMVEINGAFLLLEWKAPGGELELGQQIAFEKFSRFPRCSVIVVQGDPETMIIWGFGIFFEGRYTPSRPRTYDDLCGVMKRWVVQAREA